MGVLLPANCAPFGVESKYRSQMQAVSGLCVSGQVKSRPITLYLRDAPTLAPTLYSMGSGIEMHLANTPFHYDIRIAIKPFV